MGVADKKVTDKKTRIANFVQFSILARVTQVSVLAGDSESDESGGGGTTN